jgi:hypothetical protein
MVYEQSPASSNCKVTQTCPSFITNLACLFMQTRPRTTLRPHCTIARPSPRASNLPTLSHHRCVVARRSCLHHCLLGVQRALPPACSTIEISPKRASIVHMRLRRDGALVRDSSKALHSLFCTSPVSPFEHCHHNARLPLVAVCLPARARHSKHHGSSQQQCPFLGTSSIPPPQNKSRRANGDLSQCRPNGRTSSAPEPAAPIDCGANAGPTSRGGASRGHGAQTKQETHRSRHF